jgi:hypothetical protein
VDSYSVGLTVINQLTTLQRMLGLHVTRLHVYIVARMVKGFDACFMHVLKRLRAINNQNHCCVEANREYRQLNCYW